MTTTTELCEDTGAPARRWVRPVAVGATLLVLAGGAGAWLAHRHQSGTAAAPYRDAAAAGRITLCRDGRPVTSGSTDRPIADVVVGGQAAPREYAVAGRAATLFAYQPRAGIEASAWSGLQLGAPTAYSAPGSPSIAPSRSDTTLAQFVTAFPAVDHGWVQLRLVLSAPGAQPDTASYATADLHISGDSWTLADPGTAACPATAPTP